MPMDALWVCEWDPLQQTLIYILKGFYTGLSQLQAEEVRKYQTQIKEKVPLLRRQNGLSVSRLKSYIEWLSYDVHLDWLI